MSFLIQTIIIYSALCVRRLCFIFHVIAATILFHLLILVFSVFALFVRSLFLFFFALLPLLLLLSSRRFLCFCSRSRHLRINSLLCVVIARSLCEHRPHTYTHTKETDRVKERERENGKEPPFKSIFLAPNIAAIFSSLL